MWPGSDCFQAEEIRDNEGPGNCAGGDQEDERSPGISTRGGNHGVFLIKIGRNSIAKQRPAYLLAMVQQYLSCDNWRRAHIVAKRGLPLHRNWHPLIPPALN